MKAFSFEYPWLLSLVLLVPLLWYIQQRYVRPSSVRFSSLMRVQGLVQSKSPEYYLRMLRMLVLIFLIITLAGPRLAQPSKRMLSHGIDIMLGIDVSSSMLALDFSEGQQAITRLDAIKEVVQEFVDKRSSDKIGLFVFAGNPYLISPLTLNHAWIKRSLSGLRVGLIEDGTGIGTSIAMGINALRHAQDVTEPSSRILIVLTDGANNCGQITPEMAAELARMHGFKVYTIGVGSGGIVPTLYLNAKGHIARNAWGDLAVAKAQIPIDEAVLQDIARITGGSFFRAKDRRELSAIYRQIDQLETYAIESTQLILYDTLFWVPLGCALLLLCVERWLAYTRYLQIP